MATATVSPDQQRPLASLLSDIVGNLQQMVRAEVRLAKVEIHQEAAKVRHGAVLLAAGALALALAGGVLLAAAVAALSLVMAPWAAALVVGLAAAALGAAIVAAGLKRLRSVHLPPPKSAALLMENIQWAKQRIS